MFNQKMFMKYVIFSLSVFLVLFSIAQPTQRSKALPLAATSTATFAVADAAYTESNYPNTPTGGQQNYYLGTDLINGQYNKGLTRLFMKFSFGPASLPAGSTITNAWVYLYQYSRSCALNSTFSYITYPVTSNWAGNTMTWNSSPSVGASIGSGNFPCVSNQWKTFNVTSLAQSWFAGGANYGVSFRGNPESAAGVVFRSIYCNTTQCPGQEHPYFLVEYAVPPTSTATATNLPTFTSTPTDIPTSTPTATDVPTFTPTLTDVPAFTPTITDVPAFTPTPTDVSIFTPTLTDVPAFTPTPTDVPTFTPTRTPTRTSTRTLTPTSTLTPTQTPTRTATSPATLLRVINGPQFNSESIAGAWWPLTIEYLYQSGGPVVGANIVIKVINGPNVGNTRQGCYRIGLMGPTTTDCTTDSAGRTNWYLTSHSDGYGYDTVRIFVDGGPGSTVPTPNGVLDPGEKDILATRRWYKPVKYVALGDSYASGEGAEDYQPLKVTNTWIIKNPCHRSYNAYAYKVQPPGYPLPIQSFSVDNWGFVACTGAQTFNVYDTNAKNLPTPTPQYNEGAVQLKQDPVKGDVTMVTISIGGNDLGFEGILKHCAFPSCVNSNNLWDGKYTIDQFMTDKLNHIRPRIRQTYTRIRARMPNATVFVMGYPSVFPDTSAEQTCGKLGHFALGAGFSVNEQNFLRQVGQRLDTFLSDEATRAGFHYVSTINWFNNHEVCTKEEWIRGPGNPFNQQEWFHPNATGQKQMWLALKNYMVYHSLYGLSDSQQSMALLSEPAATFQNVSFRPGSATAFTGETVEVDEPETQILPEFGSLNIALVSEPVYACETTLYAGARVRLQGSEFEPGTAVKITVQLDEQSEIELATVNADANGDMDAVVELPATLDVSMILFQARGTGTSGTERYLVELAAVGETYAECAPEPGPDVTINTPADGAVYHLGEEVTADFACSVECLTDVENGAAIFTESPGTYQFRVSAMAPDGAVTTVSHTYYVNPPVLATVTTGGPYHGPYDQPVAISGTASSPNSDTVTTTWQVSQGCSVTAPEALTTTVSCERPGEYTLTLVAEDGTGVPVSSSTTLTLTGEALLFKGFEPPVVTNGVTDVKAGSTLPIKWSIFGLDGKPVEDAAAFLGLTYKAADCETGKATGESQVIAAPNDFKNHKKGSWSYNWKTSKDLNSMCVLVTLDLPDHILRNRQFLVSFH